MEEYFFADTLFQEEEKHTDAFAQGQEYQKKFEESHRKEDAWQALSCYTLAVEESKPNIRAELARRKMKAVYESCLKAESALNAFVSGEKLTGEQMYFIGKSYCDGLLHAKNQKIGMLWIWDSAVHGFARGQYEIGAYYLNTSCAPQQYIEDGLYFLRLSAENGCADAQKMLANLYRRGRHVERNMQEAEKWLALSQGTTASAVSFGN